MSDEQKELACEEKQYIIHKKDLPLSCPMDNMELWNAHPKVFLPIEETGRVVCPYCSAVFVLKE